MKIAGFVKTSLVDYPAHIACTVFLGSCNMNCWYCHNRDIIKTQGDIDSEVVFEHLKKRKNIIQGVVISGGEPTLNKELPNFIKKINDLGFPVKLDTNGSNPKCLSSLLSENLLNYIAMDYKAPLCKYKELICEEINIQDLKKSADIIINSGIDYEFRTTFIPTLFEEDILNIINEIPTASRYALQQYRHSPQYAKILGKDIKPHSTEYIKTTFEKIQKIFGGEVILRGI